MKTFQKARGMSNREINYLLNAIRTFSTYCYSLAQRLGKNPAYRIRKKEDTYRVGITLAYY